MSRVELRMILAMASRAYVLDEDTASRLESEGVAPLAAGLRLSPMVRLYVLDGARLARIVHAVEIPVRLDERLLRSGAVALVGF